MGRSTECTFKDICDRKQENCFVDSAIIKAPFPLRANTYSLLCKVCFWFGCETEQECLDVLRELTRYKS